MADIGLLTGGAGSMKNLETFEVICLVTRSSFEFGFWLANLSLQSRYQIFQLRGELDLIIIDL